jgi:hypothetical protein
VRTDQSLRALTVMALVSQAAVAQLRIVSAPPEPSLVNITRQWSRASALGDLRELPPDASRLELRVWGGYSLSSPTQGVVLRRIGGRWSAFLARVVRCEIQIPRSVGDTASRATMQQYTAEARRHCGTTVAEVTAGSQVLATDTLLVAPLNVPDSTIVEAWAAAERAGAFELPPRVERSRAVDDVFTYVVELRRGNEYRASVIEHLERAETRADQQVREVYAAVNRLLAPDQMPRP